MCDTSNELSHYYVLTPYEINKVTIASCDSLITRRYLDKRKYDERYTTQVMLVAKRKPVDD